MTAPRRAGCRRRSRSAPGGVLPVLVGEAALRRALVERGSRARPGRRARTSSRPRRARAAPGGSGECPRRRRSLRGRRRAGRGRAAWRRPSRSSARTAPARSGPVRRGAPRARSCRAGPGVRARPRCLGRGEREQRGGGELGPVGEREEGGQQGVPAEEGEEPGHARRRVRAAPRRPGPAPVTRSAARSARPCVAGRAPAPASSGGRRARRLAVKLRLLRSGRRAVASASQPRGPCRRSAAAARGRAVRARLTRRSARPCRAAGVRAAQPRRRAPAARSPRTGPAAGRRVTVVRDAPLAAPVAELHAVRARIRASARRRGLAYVAVVGAQLELVGEVGVDGQRQPDRRSAPARLLVTRSARTNAPSATACSRKTVYAGGSSRPPAG